MTLPRGADSGLGSPYSWDDGTSTSQREAAESKFLGGIEFANFIPVVGFIQVILAGLLSSSWLASATATTESDCGGALVGSGKIQLPPSIPRVAISTFTSDVYRFTEGELALSARNPVAVLTLNGSDYLLVLDARLAFKMGFNKFATRFLDVKSDLPSQDWVEKVESRFLGYTSEEFAIKGLASLWNNGSDLRLIDTPFFARFYDTSLQVESATRPQFYVGPEKQDRIALISLRLPLAKKIVNRAVVAIAPSPKGPLSQSAKNIPDNVWFQIPPKNGVPRYVVKDLGTTKLAVNKAGLTNILNNSRVENHIQLSGGEGRIVIADRASTLKTDQDDGYSGFVIELEVSNNPSFQLIAIKSIAPATAAEIMAISSNFIVDHLEPATNLTTARANASNVPIMVPQSFLLTDTIYTKASLELAINVLKAQKLRLGEDLASLKNGKFYFIATEKIDDANRPLWSASVGLSDIYYPRNFQFFKDDKGRLYLTGFFSHVR